MCTSYTDMGASKALRLCALGHPVGVVPVVVEVPDDGAGARRSLVMIAVRVGLVDAVHVEARTQVVLVDRSLADAGDEALPDAGVAAGRHGVGVGVPAIEVADDGDALGVRRPDGEVGAGLAVNGDEMRAKLVVETVVAALVEEVEVHVGEERGTFESQWWHGRVSCAQVLAKRR